MKILVEFWKYDRREIIGWGLSLVLFVTIAFLSWESLGSVRLQSIHLATVKTVTDIPSHGNSAAAVKMWELSVQIDSGPVVSALSPSLYRRGTEVCVAELSSFLRKTRFQVAGLAVDGTGSVTSCEKYSSVL